MKNFIIDNSLNLIKKNYPEYDEVKLAEIRYGLVSIYLSITKLIIISLIAISLNLLKELLIFLVIYNIIRAFSFGLHATKSWICLVSSGIVFIGIPYLCTILTIPVVIKSIVLSICLVFIFKNSPADTHKKPIVNPKRRLIYKYLSTFIAISFSFISIFIDDSFISNCLIFSLIAQCFVIAPSVYKLFNLPYDNYKNYQFS